MRQPARIFGAISLALLTTLVVAAAPALADAAAAVTQRTISSVATIAWDIGAKSFSQQSNRLEIVVQAPEPRPFSLTAYRFASNSASEQLMLTVPLCRSSSGDVPVALATGWQGESIAPASALAVTQIRAGEPLLFMLDYAGGNLDPDLAETVSGVILARSGDREILTIRETGPNTGRFGGFIQTTPQPPPHLSGDCRLSVERGDKILVESLRSGNQTPFVTAEVDVLVDPFGSAFDSVDGSPISGARITLVDDATGQPATVFGDDGSSDYPATIVTGSTVQDSGGTSYAYAPGDYRFPLVRPGRYRLVVEPPPGYFAPSGRTAEQMAALRDRSGNPFQIVPASFGGVIVLNDPEPVRISIPLDEAGSPILLSMETTEAEAEPGAIVRYRMTLRNPDPDHPTGAVTITNTLPAGFRLRGDSLRIDGVQANPRFDADGRRFYVDVGALAGGASAQITFGLEVGPDAPEGDAVDSAQASDDRGNRSNVADAAIRIRRDGISGRVTIVGRVVDAGCGADLRKAPGLAGVRIMMEDGSYAVTDREGRYHFEGLTPGLHVVQLDDMTLPSDRAALDCARNSRSADRAFSRFVEGRGGALMLVDFHAVQAAARRDARAQAAPRPAAASDAVAAGAERDWLAGEEPGIGWIFPEVDHNPRAPIVRVAVKHLPGQSVKLLSGGRPVDPIAYDGVRKNDAGTVAISLWRGVPLGGSTTLVAEVRNADGSLADTLRRTVHLSAGPMQAELLRDRSLLVADGVTRPVIAVRLTDRDGRPVRHGLVGDFEVPAPYYPAVEVDAQQARQLAGLERARPFWHVEGEDGIAYIELEPTTASGSVSLRFNFRDGETSREQRIEAWLDPGDRPWTIVGLAAGTVGYDRLQGAIERLGQDKDELLTDGRLALYAKGRVRGKWLMTLSYDSDKKEDQTRFGGIIDPGAYYTVYADRSERRYDAASVRRLYLKLERPQFYALFGDYETGIDEPELARYVRAFNGLKAEYRSDRVSAVAFAADSPNRHRRDDIQGNGLTGPYALGARRILANSERVTIEVRDRLRSDRIVERRPMTRHIDYDIDYAAGTLRFREPVLSRTSSLDPQFIIAEYEVDGVASRSVNAGGRASWRSADGKVQVAATAIRDAGDQSESVLAGADVRYRPTPSTEVRAEVAVSDNRGRAGRPSSGTATAWQVEAEHHGPRYDVLAYAREREDGFGVGQLAAGENGTRKIGMDARARIAGGWSLSGSAAHEEQLASGARRLSARALVEYRGTDFSARAGLTFADDRLADGRKARSTIAQLGVTRRFLDNRLEIDAQTETPLGGEAESIDFPARHRLSARYAVSSDVQLVGSYEIADGEEIDARTARIGFDLRPWAGARIALSGNVQDISEFGPRSFASYGLSQSLVLDEHWSVDMSLDGNRTLGGIDPARVLNPLHPVASGGFIGSGGLTEDFTAVTAGATYRAEQWSATGRAEYRAGDQGDRYGFTAAALRQIGEGSAAGAAFNWFTANDESGAETRTMKLELSWAHRPAGGSWSWLEKLELREDQVGGAVAGRPGPIGIPLTISGDARSRRVVNALSINFSPDRSDWLDRTEISVFWGSRYVADRYGEDDIDGWSNVIGADFRFDLSDKMDFGLAGTVRHGLGARTLAYSGGPSIGITPFVNGWMSVGWNIVGFHDRDFEDARYTRSGPYVTMRFKFDQMTLAELMGGTR